MPEEPRIEATDTQGYVNVIAPIPLHSTLTYCLPADLCEAVEIARGQLVQIKIGGRLLVAVIDEVDVAPIDIEPSKIKPLEFLSGLPSFSAELMDFIHWVSDYTLAPIGSIFKMCVAARGILEPGPTQRVFSLKNQVVEKVKMTPSRQKVIDLMQDGVRRTAAEIMTLAEVSRSVVDGLSKAEIFRIEDLSADPVFPEPANVPRSVQLSAEQAISVDTIKEAIKSCDFAPFLLYGVTGSGKTEVYFDAILEVLKDKDAQVLVLVPEIALTSQWLKRFEARFGVKPVIWHSDIGNAARRRAWLGILNGNARVIVGARSALFLPYRKLGLIVVDEEHDLSFKQEEGAIYHARDMTIVRAKLARCAVILASATPSLETLINAEAGRYKLLRLRERFGSAELPEITAVDMRKAGLRADQWLSPTLLEVMSERLDRGEQSMLFLNRRGFAPLTLCRTCGHRFGCPDCSSWLVEHKFRKELVCHQCGYTEPKPEICPQCKDTDSLVPCGPGVERLFEEVSSHFPNARIAVMTSDTLTSPKATATMVRQMEEGLIDIVIGTQIVTKGYHFPDLTLVGVVDADLGLRGGDLRAAERTYQQLMQVAGRAGRANKPGEVLLQTYEPEHPVVDAMVRYDGESLMAMERDIRQQYEMPPFGRLVALILSGADQRAVVALGRKLASTAPHKHVINILGPVAAPLARIRGQYRYRMLLHASKGVSVQKLVRHWLGQTPQTRSVKIKVDVDPQSFL